MTDSQVPTSRKLLTSIPGPRSHELQQRRKAAVSAGVSHGLPAYIEAAHGAILVDVDGNALLDLGSGIAVTSVGHSPSELVAAISEQAAKLIHSCFMVTPYEGYVEVAEALNALTPGQHEKRSALFNSGAEAVENAVKVARLAT
ncbi:MAG: aminotransferase class III-fold pyridoxal phosphate-dependent enzyme, partial [Actinomycetota bacterium]